MITLKTTAEERERLRLRAIDRGDIQPDLLLDVLEDLERVSAAYEALLAECRKRGISFDRVEV